MYYTVLNPQYKKQVEYFKAELVKCQEERRRSSMDLQQVHVYAVCVVHVHMYCHSQMYMYMY